MGIGIVPVFNPRVPSAEFQGDGKTLASEFELLDELAAASGVRSFSSFGDNRPIPDGFDGDPDELDELLGDWNEWFSIEEGLPTVRAIVERLSKERILSGDKADGLLDELKELERSMTKAGEAGATFRLEIGQ